MYSTRISIYYLLIPPINIQFYRSLRSYTWFIDVSVIYQPEDSSAITKANKKAPTTDSRLYPPGRSGQQLIQLPVRST